MIFFIAIYVFVIMILCPKTAHAYIDPGSGSYMLQIILAGLLTAGVAIKLSWEKIKSFFARNPKKKSND